eukprot:CAMPEP_0113585702 /NCGR_PEP_ID=MMETSP0015_2-20120614/33858_1 /TAXON_ID=2838 /ORGANISM="Odontella" /LENGTH=57 /DNA_ID=CAMNT_0000490997 /DNA_START=20 /DNA_END=190 /DNA_ORIENTATION=- /assembly_acc=CAM_ASM_000160
MNDIEMAKSELDRLERRFRMRVEHGHGLLPFPAGDLYELPPLPLHHPPHPHPPHPHS